MGSFTKATSMDRKSIAGSLYYWLLNNRGSSSTPLIGIGVGLQKITSNFISGLILLFEKSIENDDLVELADGTYGFIQYTGARYTLIETFEGKEIMIPNEDFITTHVTNWTFSNSKGRVEINIGVSYESDYRKSNGVNS